MFSQKKNCLHSMRMVSAFLLILTFLVLSYCPLRRTIQNLVKGTHETEQTNTAHGKQFSPVVCQGIINSSVTKLTLPEPKLGTSIEAFTAIVLTYFYSVWFFSTSEKDAVFQRKFSRGYPTSVPIFLRNRMLLI